jgi:hypothetical protein
VYITFNPAVYTTVIQNGYQPFLMQFKRQGHDFLNRLKEMWFDRLKLGDCPAAILVNQKAFVC